MAESIDTMSSELVQVAIKLGVSQSIAPDLATAMIEKFKEFAGGGGVYIPTPSKSIRDKQIIFRYSQCIDIKIVCTEFNISKSTFYRILKAK